ncbi:MAG TPA: 3-hydroxyacyl-CoA dehydrogenase NAD-binding domain-containing protein [Rhodothermales bacterium]|nr:3-hydroxyacyl-CoA dehydrogenase NAD-binding domain-containing protein [Rhodothermales bacterium]
MGNGIAHVFALAGHDVQLVDLDQQSLQKGLAAIEKNLDRQVSKGTVSDQGAREALGRISSGHEIDPGDADLIVEAVTERKDVKGQVFRTLDERAKADAILATNTSSISITWLGAQTARPGRVIGMHFFNPVPVMRLVEIVRGLETNDETFRRTYRLAEKLGKTPVAVQDFPGFVSNRILMPMINEAVYCVLENVASPEDIDTVMKLGMAHPMGPLALADLIGLDICLDILEVLHRELGEDKYRPCPLLRKMVTAGRLGRKSGRGFYDYAQS